MPDKKLEEKAVVRVEISLSSNHKNGSIWALEELSEGGRRGLYFNPTELGNQLCLINGPVKLNEPPVIGDYAKIKALVDEHNKKYENKT